MGDVRMKRISLADLKRALDDIGLENEDQWENYELWVGTPGGACAPCAKIVKMNPDKRGHGLMLQLEEPWRLRANKE